MLNTIPFNSTELEEQLTKEIHNTINPVYTRLDSLEDLIELDIIDSLQEND